MLVGNKVEGQCGPEHREKLIPKHICRQRAICCLLKVIREEKGNVVPKTAGTKVTGSAMKTIGCSIKFECQVKNNLLVYLLQYLGYTYAKKKKPTCCLFKFQL